MRSCSPRAHARRERRNDAGAAGRRASSRGALRGDRAERRSESRRAGRRLLPTVTRAAWPGAGARPALARTLTTADVAYPSRSASRRPAHRHAASRRARTPISMRFAANLRLRRGAARAARPDRRPARVIARAASRWSREIARRRAARRDARRSRQRRAPVPISPRMRHETQIHEAVPLMTASANGPLRVGIGGRSAPARRR